MTQFFVTPSDPILAEPPCEGIAGWMLLPPGHEKAAQGAELFDRLLAGPGVDSKYVAVRRTVWALSHISHIVVASLDAEKPLPPEQVARISRNVFHVDIAVPIAGQAGTGRSVETERLGVRFHYHWPFYALVVPYDGRDPVMEFYPHGEIPLPALTAAERLDTSARYVRQLRAHLTWVYQQHSDVESIQHACFDGEHALWIKGTRYVLPVWQAFLPVRPSIDNPLIPTVGRSLKAQKAEDLLSVGSDWAIVRDLALSFDETKSPDVLAYVRRWFRKRRLSEIKRQSSDKGAGALGALRSIGRDIRQVLTGNMDVFSSDALLRKWLPERYRKDSEAAIPEEQPGPESRPSSAARDYNPKLPQDKHGTPELNDLWVDRAGDVEGWAPLPIIHKQPGRPLDSAWARETDRLHWERCRDEYRATLNPIKQTILDQLLHDEETTWREMYEILMRRSFYIVAVTPERTVRAWVKDVRDHLLTLGRRE